MRSYLAALMVLAVLVLLSIGAGNAGEVRSAAWYADHPETRAKINAICKNYPGNAHMDPNCENAFQGNVTAATREAERKLASLNNGGVANIGAPPLSYWRDPVNAGDRAFWARQCVRAEAAHKSPEVMQAMYCPSLKAIGAY
jgi:hypothetical protein